MKMHDDEVHIDAELVGELLEARASSFLRGAVRDLPLVEEVVPARYGLGVGLNPVHVTFSDRMRPCRTFAYPVCSFSCQPFSGSRPRKR